MSEAADVLELEPNAADAGESGAPVSITRKAEGGLSLQFAFDIPKVPSLNKLAEWSHQQLINGALIVVVVALAAWIVYQEKFASDPSTPAAAAAQEEVVTNLRPNVATSFNADIESPKVAAGAYVDRLASVIGNVNIAKGVFIAPFASIRGDEGQPIVIAEGSNVQDGVVVHALETTSEGKPVEKNLVSVGGKKYAVYVGKGVSLAHQSQVHGPAAVGDHTFVGMQVLIFRAVVGKNVVVEPGAKIIGVTIAEGRYVPAGKAITTQAEADALPAITPDYPFATLNDGVLHVNEAFAEAYLALEHGGATGEASKSGAKPAGGH